MVKSLLCKHEALNSNPSPIKKKIVCQGLTWKMPIQAVAESCEAGEDKKGHLVGVFEAWGK
jgi:hypothetical protein